MRGSPLRSFCCCVSLHGVRSPRARWIPLPLLIDHALGTQDMEFLIQVTLNPLSEAKQSLLHSQECHCGTRGCRVALGEGGRVSGVWTCRWAVPMQGTGNGGMGVGWGRKARLGTGPGTLRSRSIMNRNSAFQVHVEDVCHERRMLPFHSCFYLDS